MSRGGGGDNSQMENLEIDQRLQKITLGKIPIPDKNIDCQTLLRQDVSYQGWLRRKKPGKLTSVIGSLLPSIMWEQMYVVINKGCLYFYGNEYEKKPNKAVSLFGYTRVMRAGELQVKQAGGVWPFKVAYVLDEHDRVHYLSAACEEDMMKWLKFIKLELYKANGVEYSEDSIIDEDIHDLETPISTGNYFNRIQGLKEIKEVVEDDSDMDSDYDYIETDEAIQNSSKAKFSDSASVSSNDSKGSNRNPVLPPSSKPGKPVPPTPPRPDNKTSTLSTGYYPKSILNHDSPPSASGKPQPPAKTGPSIPPSKPLPKPQPAVMPKQKLQKFGSTGSSGGGGDSPVRTPSGESLPFVSVTDLKKALAGSKVTAPVKPAAKPLKSVTQGAMPMPPDHSELGETKSSSVATGKPLPPIPGQTRGSNAPTAIVMPMRNPAVNQRKPYTQDLEASALWAEDAGEGQRLLMGLGVEGAYMLRCCSGGAQGRTLLVIAEYQLRKYKIFTNEAGMFALQTDFQPSFDSVHNLLNFYRTNFLPNRRTTLSQSYKELQRR